jgi:hypothetical protein
VDELRRIIGREQPLDQFHLALRRAAAQLAETKDYGACLVTCSDEFLGLTRSGFDRDVASPLISDAVNSKDRVFTVSNLCGRLEPGAFSLLDDHFTRKNGRGRKLLIIEIASHVGRLKHGQIYSYGHVERFGRRSPCCGALTSLLEPPNDTGAVRHPWFEQLNAFFGPVRLATLRGNRDSTRMIAAAIVHSALQAESAISDIFQHPPAPPTDVLLVTGVAVNQQWANGFLPVAYHHLRTDDEVTRIMSGFSLRTTPEALKIDASSARIQVESGLPMEAWKIVQRRVPDREAATVLEQQTVALEALPEEQREELDRRLDVVRSQIESIRHDPTAWRSYSRPILRGLFRGLSVINPELGIAAMLVEGGEKMFAAKKIKQIVERGPATVEGRRVLHEMEAELQQLNHEDAQQVLDILLAGKAR